jgi:hypothetical protein
MPPADHFELLSGREGQTTPVLRHGDTVLRPAGPWTPAVHALLIHLENAGFTGSPRVIGDGYDGHGREVLTYIPGDIVDPHAWSDEGIWHVGRLLRDLHDDDIAERQNLPDAAARAAQLRHFLDGYRLDTTDRRDFVTKMIEYAIRDCAAEAIQAQVTPDQGDTTALWAIAWRARSAAWMIRHRHLLEHATVT